MKTGSLPLRGPTTSLSWQQQAEHWFSYSGALVLLLLLLCFKFLFVPVAFMIWGVLPIFHAFKHILSIPSLPELLCIASFHEPLGIQLPSSSRVHAWSNNQKYELLSCVWLLATPWTITCQAPLSMGFCRQEYWSGLDCHSLLQGIFRTQGLNLGLLYCRQILYCLREALVYSKFCCAPPRIMSLSPSSASFTPTALPCHLLQRPTLNVSFTWPGSTQSRKCLGVYIPATQGSWLMNPWCRKGKVHLPCPELGQTAV